MTVSSSTNRVSYSGNGTLTAFAYTFKIFDEDDLTVILRASDGAETVQTITTHYTVSGVGDAGGGNVTFVTAPASGVTVVILREQPLTQGLDLVPNDPFPAASLEEALDKLVFMTQKHEEELGRAIKASRTNTLTGSEFTISAADRANKVFSFDSSGDLSVTQELGTFKGDWAASTAYVERDLVKDTTTNNVFIVTSAHTSSGSLPLTTNTNSDKYEKIIDITNPPGDVTFGGSITTSSSVTAGSFVIGSADINENDLEAIDEVIAGTVAASKAVVVDVNKDISSFRNLTATGDITFGSLSDGTITVTAFVDEDNMASDSATLVPTQQSVKAYVDAQVATADALSEILVNGNTTGGTDLVVSSGDTLDVNGALDVDGTIILDGNFPTGTNNVAFGNTALDTAGATSLNNTAIGSAALTALTTGNDNTAVGNNALTALNTGYDNVAIGSNAGTSITEGVGNVAVGDIAAYHLTSGDANVAVGNAALRSATTPSNNIAIGGSALYLNETGAGNIALGASSGYNLTTGSKNVIIGSYDGNEGGLDIRTSDNNLVLSDGDGNIKLYANSSGNVGIGTVSPSTKLDVNGTVTATGGTFTGDVSFGDNDKAIFGAGSDLEIYHDGSNSYIDDTGTGDLILRGNAAVKIAKYTGEAMITANADADVKLMYNNNPKLATSATGVDITGTLTSDGLTVDGEVFFDGNTNGDYSLVLGNNEGASGSVSGITRLGIQGQAASFATYKGAEIRAEEINIGDYRTNLFFATRSDTSDAAPKDRIKISSTGDISFYEDTGTTAKFFWDSSAESLGIGTSSPDAGLSIEAHQTVSSNATLLDGSRVARFKPSSNSGGRDFVQFGFGQYSTAGNDYTNLILQPSIGNNGYNSGWYQEVYRPANTSGNGNYFSIGQLTRSVSGQATQTERMRIDSSGQVGIGTSSPTLDLSVDGDIWQGNGGGVELGRVFNDAGVWHMRASGNVNGLAFGTNNLERMRIDSSGNVGIGTSSPSISPLHIRKSGSDANVLIQGDNTRNSQLLFGDTDDVDVGKIQYSHSSNYMGFTVNASERMRIDSSGNLLVGTTVNSIDTEGALVRASGQISACVDGNYGAVFQRKTSDGDIVLFRKDGTTVGSIGSFSGSYLSVGSGDTGLMFHSVNNIIYPHNTSTNSTIDDAISLGSISTRFRSLFLSNGVYLGGVTSSNLLDDYEEGTWTPVDGSGAGLTFSVAVGTYTKIGRMVFVSYAVTYPATSDTTDMAIGGLPFTPHTNFRFGVAQSYTSNSVAGDAQVTTVDTDIVYRKNGTATKFINSELSGLALRGSFSYETS